MSAQNLSWRVCVFLHEKTYHPVGLSSKALYINYIVACVVNIIIFISTILLNVMTIVAYWNSTQLKRRTSYFLVMLLSFVDLANGLFGQSSFVLMLIKTLIGGPHECGVYTTATLTSCSFASLAIATLFLLNFERYVNIVHPFFTRSKVTKSKLLIAASILWGFGLAISIPTRFSNIINGITLLVVVLSSVYFYVRIFIASRRASLEASRGSRTSGSQQLQDIKLAKSCAIVVSCTFLCLTPFAVVNIVMVQRRSYIMFIALNWAATAGFASATLNSIIFFWRNPMLRKEAKKIIMTT